MNKFLITGTCNITGAEVFVFNLLAKPSLEHKKNYATKFLTRCEAVLTLDKIKLQNPAINFSIVGA